MNWLITYLTGRYFRVPENIKIQVRGLTKNEDEWPSEEPPSAEKTFNFQTVNGTKALFDQYAEAKGTVPLTTADAHWWVFKAPREDSKKMSTRGGRTCKVGVVFQDEVYVHLRSTSNRGRRWTSGPTPREVGSSSTARMSKKPTVREVGRRVQGKDADRDQGHD